jgi:predicted MFS family arabinose efflux permease
MTRVIPHDLEAGGGLQVALVQLAITGGASIGGVLFDTAGWWSPFVLGAALLTSSALLAIATVSWVPRFSALVRAQAGTTGRQDYDEA